MISVEASTPVLFAISLCLLVVTFKHRRNEKQVEPAFSMNILIVVTILFLCLQSFAVTIIVYFKNLEEKNGHFIPNNCLTEAIFQNTITPSLLWRIWK